MEKFYNAEKLNGLSDLKFLSGQIDVILPDLLNKISPSGKVAFVTTDKTHKAYGKIITTAVSKTLAKTVSIIMPTPAKNTLEYFGSLFKLPDDVRSVVVMDRTLYRAASYFAEIKGLPLVFIPVSPCLSGALEKRFFVKNGNLLDYVCGATDVYVAVDKNLLESELADAYAFNMARLNTLIDYRVMHGKKADAKAYFTAMEGVKGTYRITFEKQDLRPLCALYNGFKIAVACRTYDFISGSSERVAATITCGGDLKPSAELFCALKLIELYKSAFKVKRSLEMMPDLTARAERVAAILSLDRAFVNSALLSGRETLIKNLDKTVKMMNSLVGEAEELFSHVESIKGTYFSLSGERESEIPPAAIKYGGDTPFGINALSVLRELGITDHPYINA